MSAEQNEAVVCRITETEMRALIFELRPESLEAEGLVAALEKQTAVLKAKHGIEVEATLCEEPEASLKAKEATYRIAREALHNTVKHASEMQCRSGSITLKILDYGVGFDPTGDFAGHLGLRSMRERAAAWAGRWRGPKRSGTRHPRPRNHPLLQLG
jgi:signal transduction histidine kinase